MYVRIRDLLRTQSAVGTTKIGHLALRIYMFTSVAWKLPGPVLPAAAIFMTDQKVRTYLKTYWSRRMILGTQVGTNVTPVVRKHCLRLARLLLI